MKLHDVYDLYKTLPEYFDLEIDSVDSQSIFGDYLINTAATRGILDEVLVLLNAGADVNSIGEDGFTPLHNAVEQFHVELIRNLINLGADASLENNDGLTPLELAKLLDYVEVERFLIVNRKARRLGRGTKPSSLDD